MTGSHRFPLKNHKGEWCNTCNSTWKSSVWTSTTSQIALPNPPKVEFYILHTFSEYLNALPLSMFYQEALPKNKCNLNHAGGPAMFSNPGEDPNLQEWNPRMSHRPQNLPECPKLCTPPWDSCHWLLATENTLLPLNALVSQRTLGGWDIPVDKSPPGVFYFVVLDFW